MHSQKNRFLSSLVLATFIFFSCAPRGFADATDRTYGFYGQTYEINSTSSRFNLGRQSSNASGAYTYSLPLVVPQGRNGLSPTLNLNYNSQSRSLDSLVGYGWSLEFPSITRINKRGTNNLYTETDFASSLSGELVNVSGTPYGEYASKVENGAFWIYEYQSDGSWTATDKSGTVYSFGTSTDSQVYDSADSTHVYQWILTEIRDANDNYISYSYTKDNGQIYPDVITYTGSGTTDGPFMVDFTLEARNDRATSYQSGFEVTTAYRIQNITVTFDGSTVREYAFAYTTPDNNDRSLLDGVTETAYGDGTPVTRETSFDYDSSNKGWTSTSGYSIPVYFYMSGDNNDKGVEVADVNGDGLLDLMNSGNFSSSTNERKVYINQGDGSGWSYDSGYTIPVYFWDYSGNLMKNSRLSDVNGDGFSDIFFGSTDGGKHLYVYDDATQTWTEDTSYTLPVEFNAGYLDDKGIRLLDMNGDGFSDYVQSLSDGSGTYSNIYLFDPEAGTWSSVSSPSIPVYFNHRTSNSDEGIELTDVNGDGFVDIVQSRYESSSHQAVYLNTGDGTGWASEPGFTIPVYFWNSSGVMMNSAQILDVDGDGLGDIVYSESGGGSSNGVYINQGDNTGWVKDSSYSVPVYFNQGYGDYTGVQAFDADGDSLVDFVQSRSKSGTTQGVYLNDATPELLTTVHHSQGATTNVTYQPSTAFDNPDLPFVMNLVSEITVEDGVGGSSTTSYDYEGGAYYYEDELNRQFAYFNSITKTEEGRETITYYLQDSLATLGTPYKTEVYDASGNLYVRTVDTYATADLGYDNTYVYKTDSLTMTYDGSSSHRDSGASYTYDSYGNVETITSYGEVSGSSDGSFTDVTTLDEKYMVEYTYAVDSSGLIRNKLSHEVTEDSGGSLLKRSLYYYDSLPNGQVSTGNLTRTANYYDEGGIWHNTYYTYDAYGLISTIKNPRNYVTRFTYDSYNLYPAVTTNAKLFTVSTEYDYGSGQVTSRTDENGFTSETTYDGLGRVLTVSVPDPVSGTLTTLSTTSYDDTTVPSSSTKSTTVNGVTSENVNYYDGLGRKIQSNTLAEGGVYTTIDTWYDELGNVEEQSLPYETSSSAYGRDTTQYSVNTTFDPLSRPLTVTAPTGTTTYSYSLWENTTTDANGVSKVYNYDAAGRLIEVEEQNGTESYTTEYTYDPLGQLVTLTDAQGNVRNFDYDSLGRKISQEDLHDPSETSFGTWTYTYDKNNNLLTQTDPAGQTITWAYDVLDRVGYEDWDLSTPEREAIYTYDTATNGRMRLYQVRSGTSIDYIQRFNAYDKLGNPVNETRYIKSPSGTYTMYSFRTTYDLLSRPTKLIYPGSVLTVNYTYNETGALERVTRGTTTLTDVVSDFDYSPMGQVEYMAYGNGVSTTNTYDPAQSYRLTNKVTVGTYTSPDTDGDSLSDTDESIQGTDPNDTDSDDDGLWDGNEVNTLGTNPLSGDTDGDGLGDYAEVITHSSDPNDPDSDDDGLGDYAEAITHSSDPNDPDSDDDALGDYAEAITCGSNPNDADSDDEGLGDYSECITYSTDPNDPDTDDDGMNDFQEVGAGRDPLDPLALLEEFFAWLIPSARASTGNIQDLTYTYDNVGNIMGVADASITPTNKTLTYTYDDLNRLLTASTSGFSAGDYTESYTYDEVGNLTYKSDVGTLLYDGTGADANPHAATSVNGTAYTYDANGNLLSDGTHTYTWDARNRLTGSGSKSFSYDHAGTRYKTVDSSSGSAVYTYYLSPYQEVRDGVSTYYIFAAGQRVASLEAGNYTYYHQDHLGGTALTSDSSGAVSQVYDYYPYGSEALNTQLSTTDAAHSFTDKELDEDLGLYYFEARWYSSDIGRFSSLDPAQLDGRVQSILTDPQSLNFYAYSRNNPVNLVDPSGEFWDLIDIGFAAVTVGQWLWNVGNAAVADISGDSKLADSYISQATANAKSGVFDVGLAILPIAANPKSLTYVDDVAEVATDISTKIDNVITDAISGTPDITFGHGARHLEGTGLSPDVVEQTIQSHVRESIEGASETGNFWGRVDIEGQSVEYRAYTRTDNGDIHIGTYYTAD